MICQGQLGLDLGPINREVDYKIGLTAGKPLELDNTKH